MEDAAGSGFLIGDTGLLRPKSSILVEAPGETGSRIRDAVRKGLKFVGLVVSEGDKWTFGGYDGVRARCGYECRAIGSLGGKRKAVLPNEAERSTVLVP